VAGYGTYCAEQFRVCSERERASLEQDECKIIELNSNPIPERYI
jgi:hypothetical protein